VSRRGDAVVRVRSSGAETTEAIGGALARVLPRGTVVGLAGPLGAGKTCFARGLAAALGIDPSLVTSPTFVYLVDYAGRDLTLHHADLYRLADLPADSAEQAYESIGWWDCYRGPLPQCLVHVEFVIENAEHRRIEARFAMPEVEARAEAFEAALGTLGLPTER